MDPEKYRRLFVDEASDHVAEMSRALTALEGGSRGDDPDEAVDTLFRMAHSIKGMAASLEYDSVSTLAHRFEDWMEPLRAGARPDDPALDLMSRVLRALEEMVAEIDGGGDPADPHTELLLLLAEPPGTRAASPEETPRKKARPWTRPRSRARSACAPRSSTASCRRWAS